MKKIANIILNRFEENFAKNTSDFIIEENASALVYEFANGRNIKEIDKKDINKLYFRSAYILEYMFFNYRFKFVDFEDDFYKDFPNTVNPSVKRHFAKIMAHLLKERMPNKQICEQIAQSCAEWVSDDKIKVAVKIWCVEILFLLKRNVDWVGEILPEILQLLSKDASPGMKVRLKRWREVYR